MKEISAPRTNVEHMINAIVRADNETMAIAKNGDPNQKGYIIIHDGTGYLVNTNYNNEITNCTCPHNTFRHVICKHMIKVALKHGLSIAGLPEMASKENKEENEKIKPLKVGV